MRLALLALLALAGCGGVAAAETLFADAPVCPGGDGLPSGWTCCGEYVCGPGNACQFNANFGYVCEPSP